MIFSVLSTMMFLSRVLLQGIPSVHLLGLFIAIITRTYRWRALIPLYGYVLLEGLFTGFSMWWMPYLYIWLPLWGAFMGLGKLELPRKIGAPLYMIVCALHGLSFGLLYAPMQALMFGFSFQATIAWIIAGLPFDIIHAIGNLAAGTMIIPLSTLLKNLDNGQYRS